MCDGKKESLFLLSTDLCPAHRLEVVDTIKKRLKQGQPCCVVATQCIEAGVDLDFDAMYRLALSMQSFKQPFAPARGRELKSWTGNSR